jgi:hypothetical protein
LERAQLTETVYRAMVMVAEIFKRFETSLAKESRETIRVTTGNSTEQGTLRTV